MPAAVRSVGEIVDRRISSNWCVAAELPRCGPAERPGGSGALSCRGPLADLTRRRRALQGGPGATERGGVAGVRVQVAQGHSLQRVKGLGSAGNGGSCQSDLCRLPSQVVGAKRHSSCKHRLKQEF